jgi:two-component system, NtrC family, sensor kinase
MRRLKKFIMKSDKLQKISNNKLLKFKKCMYSNNRINMDMKLLIQEIEVYKVEIELQNDELRRSRNEIEKELWKTRTKVEEGLKRFSDLYDFAPVGYFSLDHNSLIRQVNLSGSTFLGVERALLVGMPLRMFVENSDLLRFNRFFDKMFTSHTQESCEILLRKKDTSIYVRIDAVLSEDRQECRLAMTDITDRVRAEHAMIQAKNALESAYVKVEDKIRDRTLELAEANKHLKDEILARAHAIRNLDLILKSISAVLIVVDKNEIIFRWNCAAENAFGIPVVAAEGSDFRSLPISWDWELVGENIDRCVQTGKKTKATNVSYERFDGTVGYFMLTVSPMLDDLHVQTGYLLLCEDITELRLLEARLFQGARLEAIGQLAAGIAHEINSPAQYVSDSVTFLRSAYVDYQKIFAILDDRCCNELVEARRAFGELCLIKNQIDVKILAAEIPKTFERIFDGIERISSIVRAMNIFSSPRLRQKRHVNIHEIIENSLIIAGNEIKHVANIEKKFDNDLKFVIGFADELGQVMLNVLINAIHAVSEAVKGQKDKGVITITTRKLSEYAEICVRDTGVGIPKNIQDKVFNLFFTTKDPGKGTGQGLTIVYDIVVNKHGGSITFESESGIGTNFIILLPLIEH